MKKVICPACGLVNLEKFVTFPHCAACGAPLATAPVQRTSTWKRPVSVPLWAATLGLCCVGLGIAGVLAARETRRLEDRRLIVYTQLPRRVRVGKVAQLRLGLDAIEPVGSAESPFENLELRLSRTCLADFALVSISPTPKRQIARGDGLYFAFGTTERDQPLTLALRPRRAGNRRFVFSVAARDFLPFEWRGSLSAAPAAPVSP